MPSPRPFHVTFVCSGNICRSPMGHVILEQLVAEAGLADAVTVSSSGTGDWHVGERADPRTVDVLAHHGYDGSGHRAREFDATAFDDIDLVLASDDGHVRHLRRLAPTSDHRSRIRLVREFDPTAVAAGTLETSDPWYGDEEHFRRCFTEVEAACKGVLEHIRGRLEMEHP
ncbi:low molecular weight protein-tyrosine-phosphatase [Intrasporangium calvum]|uniref:protein-tyrosine-phosphatase n=1 Tax=Intrasporangium calvum (strain ATCC 23552 / DSM 43043 / JCM 3097 / NBRC 12989 / NCIMB 10167 / NRRL B-3866 / 7 KIP) TaxID=710696 RepID=E6S629_INTC7|nr:low molecular weight protein-tyrosine-phosphatase [Intrasporangium calvum]ADU46769.1 protein tyrosine phosphatase [Intrasporangium calvum DSM 43043]AXG15133.1 low molecular weight phosphotyrosine protein phosphatase [Intrasporangium calvum]